MIGNRREEDQADLWLREHDPYYLDKSHSKKKKLERFYETPEQEHRRVQMELRSLVFWVLFFLQNFEYRYTFYMILWAYCRKR